MWQQDFRVLDAMLKAVVVFLIDLLIDRLPDRYAAAATMLRLLPRVGGNLSLCYCRSLTTLPQDISSWPPRVDGEPHMIFLEGTGIPPQVRRQMVDWLNQQDQRGVQLHFYEAPAVGLSDFPNLEQAWHA